MFDSGEPTIALAALFVSISLMVFAVARMIDVHRTTRRRLAGETRGQIDPHRGSTRFRLRTDFIQIERGGFSSRSFLLNPYRWAGRYVRTRMRHGGLGDTRAIAAFLSIQGLLVIAIPAVAYAAAPSWFDGLAGRWAVAVTLLLMSVGIALPGLWLVQRIRRRRREIGESLPDALDMMVVCVEAGLGLDAALGRVGTQLAPVHPLLAAELDWVALELRAGKGREEALRTFAARIDQPQVTSIVTLLIQSEALGAGIARTLRVHADDMRANRLLRAEESAHKLPVLLTVPLVICVLPAMLVAVLLPGVLTITRSILPGLGH